MQTKPDTMKISAAQREEIEATSADLFVAIKGTSLVTGSAALKKAREVSQLVEELTDFGLPPDAIHLQSVHTEASSGAILRSSSATYRLRIRCEALDRLEDLLGIVAGQKNATLEQLEWKYPEEAAREQALDKALRKADMKARRVAAALGVKLLGIYGLTEIVVDREAGVLFPAAPAMEGTARMARRIELGMEIQHGKTIEVRAEIEYRISAFD
jgi:uncharacterized protein YggE